MRRERETDREREREREREERERERDRERKKERERERERDPVKGCIAVLSHRIDQRKLRVFLALFPGLGRFRSSRHTRKLH
jgi:hypothetical protein